MCILAHFGNIKDQMKKIGSEKNTPRCPFDRNFFESNVLCPFLLFRLIEIQIENEWLEIVQLSHPIRRWQKFSPKERIFGDLQTTGIGESEDCFCE